MAIFGWIVLFLATMYAIGTSIFVLVGYYGLTGKVSPGAFIPAIIAAAMTAITVNTCPFTVVVQ